jgi:outer membrane protein assembly factor BamB
LKEAALVRNPKVGPTGLKPGLLYVPAKTLSFFTGNPGVTLLSFPASIDPSKPVLLMKLHLASLACALTTGWTTLAVAADWPQWRGPDRTDVSRETGLLKQWPEGGPKLLWLNEDAGLGYSGHAIAKGRLYTLGLRQGSEFAIALEAGNGKELWAAEIGPVLKNGWGDGPRSTPTVDGDRVYALSGNGYLACLNAADGKEVWKVRLAEFGGRTPNWGYTESVLVDGDLVICTPGGGQGTLLALNKKTGEKVWQTADWTDNAHYSSPIVIEHNGARQFVQLTSQHVAGVEAKSGKTLWTSEWPGKTAVIPTPIFKDGHVYIASGYGVGCKLVKLGPGHKAEDVYMNQNMVNHHGGVLLVGDHLYGYSDQGRAWVCQDFKTGEIVWTSKALGKGAVHCADGMLYCLDEGSGTVVLAEASPKGWTEHGRFKLTPQTQQRNPRGKIWTHPVVANGKLYLRDQELLFCFDVKGGGVSSAR